MRRPDVRRASEIHIISYSNQQGVGGPGFGWSDGLVQAAQVTVYGKWPRGTAGWGEEGRELP